MRGQGESAVTIGDLIFGLAAVGMLIYGWSWVLAIEIVEDLARRKKRQSRLGGGVLGIDSLDTEQLAELGQLIERSVKPKSRWVLVIVPPHDCSADGGGNCKVQTVTNVGDLEFIEEILSEMSEVFGERSYEPLFTRRVENH